MNKSGWSKRSLKFLGILLAISLVIYLLWDGSDGWGSSDIVAGLSLLLTIGAIIYQQQIDNKAERAVAQRIKTEYPSESQQQVFDIYRHLKTKELEGLFLKMLDDAKGDVNAIKKFAALAESIGWRAFLENHW
jgi:hypothetical protein